MISLNRKLGSVITLAVILFVFSGFVFAEGEVFRVYGGSADWGFNHAGYSDNFNWGYEPNRHPYDYHEMLSGEFGAALAWSQSGSNQAYFFTDQFYCPHFSTGTIFQSYGNPSYLAWNDPNNPINNDDTAYAVIRDNQNRIQVRMDYEVVDLGEQDVNGVGGSPITFRDANGTVAYVNSERWIVLCTYSIKNVPDSNITGLEFYQMLCGYPDGYDGYYSSYTSENYSDPLSNYVPYNLVHKEQGSNYAGKFRYDISQWGYGNPNTEHVDWISFSSTIPPDALENGMFYSSGGEPTTGTYTNIKNRSLNGLVYSTFVSGSYNRVAGAMKWNLGNLEPNQTKKITIAVMFGCKPVNYTPPTPVVLTKTDDIETCILPYDSEIDGLINYTIHYDACGFSDMNVMLVDYLPDEVDFNNASGSYDYNSDTNTVTWNIGTMGPNDTNSFHLQVKVNSTAMQGQKITNLCELTGDNFSTQATRDTNICCMDNKVYVDKDANGTNNGSSWTNAYKELRDALVNVRDGNCGCADQIWVAAGTYKPTEANDPSPSNKTFQMIDGINIYGHFAGWESSIDQRNLADSNNDTILTGDIDDNNTSDVQYVITAADSRINGFTVKKGYYSGIYCNGGAPTIANCVIKNNNYKGLFCEDAAYPILTNTFINNNSGPGIYCDGSSMYIDKCTVGPNNVSYGLYISFCNRVDTTDSIFNGNSGGGILATNGYNLFVERCDISDNKSGTGIICGSGDIANIRRCTIQRNNYEGLSIGSGSNVQASLNIISNNNSSGVSIPSGTGNGRLVSNLIYGNKSWGIEVWNNNTAIINNTIVNNNSYGICGYDSDPNITSNIIWGNGGGLGGGSSFTKVNYNCIQNYTGDMNTNINLNPQFVDGNTTKNNYHLKKISPCIDRGDPNFNGANLFDIDSEDRVMDGNNDGNSRVDIGADEFCPYDLSQDGFVNFLDFAVFARTWRKSQGETNYNYLCDYFPDGKIDYKDLNIFCDYWLYPSDWEPIGGQGAYFADNSGVGQMEMMMSMASEQLLLLAGEGETAAIYLLSDVNEPNSGDEVTVQVYSDVPLFAMELGITVTGDANITDAMSTADCNQFGWDPSWPTDPLIDPTGWVYISGVKWESDANGVVGYIKFRYNSGRVSVSITEGDAFDADCGAVLISGEALIFGESE